MNEDFITIREASELTGKSDKVIRGLIKDLLKQSNPEATDLIRQDKTGGGFIYKINKDFLLKELKISEPADPVKEQVEPQSIVKEVIEALKSQLNIKDRQIKDLGNKIDGLIERDRETNIILKSLQDKVFLLGAGQTTNKEEKQPTEAMRSPERQDKEGVEEAKPVEKDMYSL